MTRAEIVREWAIRDALVRCPTCGHPIMAHTDRGRCKVRGCKAPTVRAHR